MTSGVTLHAVVDGLLLGLGCGAVAGLAGWLIAAPRTRAGRRLPVRRSTAAIGLAVLGLLAGGITVPALAAGASRAAAIGVDERACGANLPRVSAGHHVVEVTDDARDPVDVYLIDPADSAVYAEIPDLPPGTTLPLATTYTHGRYALRCVFTDNRVLTSATRVVTGTAPGAVAATRPMPDLALQGPVDAYRADVRHALPTLLADSSRLDADVAAGDLPQARIDWLTAHLDYERLGAAYNTFGDFDDEIDGLADGLPGSTGDPSWTGFFRIEFGLWHSQSAGELRPLTRGLVADIRGLIRDFPSEDTDPADLPLRTHEILENGFQFQLTGIADYGSGTTLATLYANTQGTRAVLRTISALITARDPGLPAAIDDGLATVQTDLTACRAADGHWTPVAGLSHARRQRLDGDLGRLLELLAQVPNLLHPRTSG